jgi:hypothetical protein
MASTSQQPAKTSPQRDPRVRQLVPLIEALSPDLRDHVVHNIEALLALARAFERVLASRREEPSGRPNAAKR